MGCLPRSASFNVAWINNASPYGGYFLFHTFLLVLSATHNSFKSKVSSPSCFHPLPTSIFSGRCSLFFLFLPSWLSLEIFIHATWDIMPETSSRSDFVIFLSPSTLIIPTEDYFFPPAPFFLISNTFNVISSSKDFIVRLPVCISKLHRLVNRNSRPRLIGVSSSSGISMIWKSMRKTILSIPTTTSSTIPYDCLMVWSTNFSFVPLPLIF